MRYKHKREPLTQNEMNELANACKDSKEKLVIFTLLDSGMRVEEFCGLTTTSIDWQRHTIIVYGKNTTGEGGKKRRTVPMTARVIPLLESHFAVNTEIGFCTRTANNIVHKVANRARIRRPCSPHVLRHSFAITCLRKGMSIPMLSKLLGHEDMATTMIYLNMQNEEAIEEFKNKW